MDNYLFYVAESVRRLQISIINYSIIYTGIKVNPC